MEKIFPVLIMVIWWVFSPAGETPCVAGEQHHFSAGVVSPQRMLSGNLRIDLLGTAIPSSVKLQNSSDALKLQSDPLPAANSKSLYLAAVLSAAVPGAGEFYSESYIKGGAFFAAEVVSWFIYFSYNRRGDRATDEFQNFADANWSVVDYTQWLNDNAKNVNSNSTCAISINPDKSLPPWLRVNWNELNACERSIGGIFTHALPRHGDQQYYELIGKYGQYNPGWKDADRSSVSSDNISNLFRLYSGMRGRANNFYSTASTALAVVIINHLLSAVDGAWSATTYNKFHAEVGMRLQQTPIGVEARPMVKFQVKF